LTPWEGVLELRAVAPAGATTASLSQAARLARVRLEFGGAQLGAYGLTVEPGGRGLVAAVDWARLRTGPVRATLHATQSGPPVAAARRLLAVGGSGGWTLRELRSGWELSDTTGGATARGGALWLAAAPARLGLPEGARLLGQAAAVEGVAAALLTPLRLGLRAGPPASSELNDARAALYARDAQGTWSWLGARRWRDEHDGEPVLGAPLEAPAVVAALLDVQPPVLGRFQVAGRPVAAGLAVIAPRAQRSWKGVTLSRWPELVLPMADACAGIDAAAIAITLDGQPYPARWDPEAERLHVEFDADPGAGDHAIAVTVADRVGNRSSAQQRVRLSAER
jgi:hypothetical protein